MISYDVPYGLKVVTPALFCVLSLLGSVSLVLCYKKVIRMRHNAGRILLHIVICETLLTLLYCLSFFYVDSSSGGKYSGTFIIRSPGCQILGFFQVYLSFSYSLLNTALIHNFYMSLTENQKSSAKRNKLYTWGTLILSLVLSIVTLAENGISLTPYGFCGMGKSAKTNLVAFFPLCVSYPFGIYAIIHAILALKNDHKENQRINLLSDPYEYQVKLSFVKSHCGFIAVFFFTWFPFYVDNLVYYFHGGRYSSPGISVVAFNLLSVTSFLMMVVRLTDPLLRKVLKKGIVRRFWSLNSAKSLEAIEPIWSQRGTVSNEHILLQNVHTTSQGELLDSLENTVLDPHLKKFRSIAPKVGCNKHYKSMLSEDINIIILSLENLVSIQDSDAEPPKNQEQTPWPQFYYSQICVKELNLHLKRTATTQEQDGKEEEEISLNAIIHAPRVFDDLLTTFNLTRTMLLNSIRFESNKDVVQRDFNRNKPEIYKHYQFLTYNKEVLIQRMEKEHKFDFLESFLSAYHDHMTNNSGSCLQKILGLYSLGSLQKKYNILLIKNIYRPYYDSVEHSRPSRLVERIMLDGYFVRKDTINSQGVLSRSRKYSISMKVPEPETALLQLKPKDRVRLLQIIRSDLEFLEKAGILEYKINFLLSRNSKKNDTIPIEMNTNLKNTLGETEFLSTLTTADEEFRVEIFISLESFIHAKKIGYSSGGEDGCLFSRANPQLYRQCVEEFLVQYL